MVFWVTLCREKSEMILLCSWNRSSLLAASLSRSLKCLRQHGGNISLCHGAAEEVQAGVMGITGLETSRIKVASHNRSISVT